MKVDTTLPQVRQIQALAKSLADDGANPPVAVRVHCNGPRHAAVIHVTHGEPRPVTRELPDGSERTTTPVRPAPYSISVPA